MNKSALTSLTLLEWLKELSAVPRLTKQKDLLKLKRLDLSNRKLEQLHEDIGSLQSLSYLNLANNVLSTLPQSLDRLSNLISLDLRRNQLKTLPQALGSFELGSLNISGNKIEDISMLSSCHTLRTLDLSGNFLHTLEGVFDKAWQLRSINAQSNLITEFIIQPKSLPALEILNLSSNRLNRLPAGITHLESLSHLNLSDNTIEDDLKLLKTLEIETLDLSSNKIKALELEGLSELATLTVDDNPIEHVTIGPSFAPKLQSFSAQGCGLEAFIDLPEKELTSLSFSSNRIQKLPENLDKYVNLHELDIDENAITHVPLALKELRLLGSLYLGGNPLNKESKSFVESLGIEYCDILVKKDIVVRKAQHNDLKQMARLLAQLFALEADFEYDYEKHIRALTLMYEFNRADLLVAKYRNKVVGMVTLQELVSSAEGGIAGQLEDLVVDSAFQKMGVGTRLIRKVFDLARERSYVRIQLAADKVNHKALRFYRQRGFNLTNLSTYHYIGIES